MLSAAEQREFLQFLEQGGSPALACRQLGVAYRAFTLTLKQDPDFRRQIDEVNASLGQNVVAALYRSAMEGSVTAQTFWLKHRPPAEWSADEQERTVDQETLQRMTDEELLERARTMGVDPADSVGGGA